MVGAVPGVQQVMLAGMLRVVQKSLCKMWRVPSNLEAAIRQELVIRRGRNAVLGNTIYDVGVTVSLAGGLAASILTAGIAAGAAVPVYGAASYAQAKAATALFMSVSVLVLGVILDAKAQQSIQHWNAWNYLHSEEHYRARCTAFPASPKGLALTTFVTSHAPSWLSPVNTADQIASLKRELVSFFKERVLSRPTSFYSQMQAEH
jgi:hypothetical protein